MEDRTARQANLFQGETAQEQPTLTVLHLEQFEQFWSGYHPKRRVAKRQAIKAWNAAVRKGIGTEMILAALKRYMAQVQSDGTEPRYIMHPSTFINGRWEDYTQDGSGTLLRPESKDWALEKELANEHSRRVLERRRRARG